MPTDRVEAKFPSRRASLLDRLKRQFIYVTPRFFSYVANTVVFTPWAMGLISLYLLALVPQMREVYIGLVEEHDAFRGVFGLLAIGGFSALLYHWNQSMVTRRIDRIYPDHADLFFDRAMLGIRDLKSIIVSALPFAGLALGLLAADLKVIDATKSVQLISDAMGNGLTQDHALQSRLPGLPPAIVISIAVTIAAYITLVFVLHRSRDRPRLRYWLTVASFVLSLLVVGVPIIASNSTLFAARILGPLASTGLVLIAGAVILRALVWMTVQTMRLLLTLPSLLLLSAHRAPYALKQLFAALIPMFAVTFLVIEAAGIKYDRRNTRPKPILEELHTRSENTNSQRDKLTKTFISWLKARETGAREYPVFIVTAQGGGIYAASATSFFLAAMQERCPAFAEHIFAISAVSGGSIGSSLFNAALAEDGGGKVISRANGTTPGCLDQPQPGRLSERLSRITLDDHLSPLVAYILPDLFRDIRELFVGFPLVREPCNNEVPFEWFGRDQMLEKSFIASFGGSQSGNAHSAVCPSSANANLLVRNFGSAWSPENKLPALLLNATWVETGYRVAFSPFPLKHLGEGTLYSFEDVATLPGPGHETTVSWQNPSLIGAAAVSARFPFVLPPWASSPNATNRWTFVDGGYADASGATTGLELYRELKGELKGGFRGEAIADVNGRGIRPEQIKLYLIVLSDAYVEPDFSEITGTSLDDFISPFNTVLTVRDLLARRAVTQAYSEVSEENLITVQLDQQTFPLALGWKISGLSSDIIRFASGRPDHCHPELAEAKDWAVWTVNHNSCQLSKITGLLTPKEPLVKEPAPSNLPADPAPVKMLGPWQVQPQ